jgi:hypothetical protein
MVIRDRLSRSACPNVQRVFLGLRGEQDRRDDGLLRQRWRPMPFIRSWPKAIDDVRIRRQNEMLLRNTAWIALCLAASAAAAWIVLRPWNPQNNLELFAVMLFFMGAPIGGFWMIYRSIRYERKPLPYVLLACVPLSFVWYYVERVRPKPNAEQP